MNADGPGADADSQAEPGAQAAGGATAAASGGRRFWRGLREVALIVIIALLISTAVKTWVMRSFVIPSASMEQTLLIGDRILVNQLPWTTAHRGDVVVFDDPGGWLQQSEVDKYKPNPLLEFVGLVPSDAGHQLVKRVIGEGGDTVQCCDAQGRLQVNGHSIDETYLAPGTAPSEVEFKVTVPPDHYWVMGDNRGNSLDSRFNKDTEGGSYVPADNVVGTVFAINWPLSRLSWVSNPSSVYAGVPSP